MDGCERQNALFGWEGPGFVVWQLEYDIDGSHARFVTFDSSLRNVRRARSMSVVPRGL